MCFKLQTVDCSVLGRTRCQDFSLLLNIYWHLLLDRIWTIHYVSVWQRRRNSQRKPIKTRFQEDLWTSHCFIWIWKRSEQFLCFPGAPPYDFSLVESAAGGCRLPLQSWPKECPCASTRTARNLVLLLQECSAVDFWVVSLKLERSFLHLKSSFTAVCLQTPLLASG